MILFNYVELNQGYVKRRVFENCTLGKEERMNRQSTRFLGQ